MSVLPVVVASENVLRTGRDGPLRVELTNRHLSPQQRAQEHAARIPLRRSLPSRIAHDAHIRSAPSASQWSLAAARFLKSAGS